jgi:HlyD family secretion protein
VLDLVEETICRDQIIFHGKEATVKFLVILVILLAAGGGYYFWRKTGGLPAGFASGNGRVEATEVDVSAKQQGRVEAVHAKEGDMVEEGQLLAQMDAAVLRAQLAEAEAAAQRDREVAATTATQRQNEHELAMRERDRAQQLAKHGVIEKSKLDSYVTAEQTAKARLDAAKAQVASRSGHSIGRRDDREVQG